MLFFLPILFINIWGVVFAIIRSLDFTSNLVFFFSILIGIGFSLGLGLGFMFDLDFVFERFI